MEVTETDLPGVGKKHEIDLRSGVQAVILTHNTGNRELLRKDDADADPDRLLELTDQEARVLGTVLEGAYFQPVKSGDAETLFSDNMMIDWMTIPESSPVVGDTVSTTVPDEVTVLAVYQNEKLLTNSFATTTFGVNDRIIVAGSQDAISGLSATVAGEQ